MQRPITEKQFKSNVAKFGFKTFEPEVLDRVNVIHKKIVGDLLKQYKKQKKKTMKGGRVAFPITYFGGDVNSSQASISGDIRPEMPLNDPSGVLGTDKALQPYVADGGSRPHFVVTKKAVLTSVKHLIGGDGENKVFGNSKNMDKFLRDAKEKLGQTFTDMFTKISNVAKETANEGINVVKETANEGINVASNALKNKATDGIDLTAKKFKMYMKNL